MNTFLKNIKTLLPNENQNFTVKDCNIYLSEGIIAGIDRKPEGFCPELTIDGTGKLLIPGLINAHTHSYMTVFRNWADDLPFSDWLFGKIMPVEERLTEEDCYWGSLLACMEMLRTGTTSFLDIYLFSNASARAVKQAGMRAVLSRCLTESGGKADGMQIIEEAKAEIRRYAEEEMLSFMLAPHAPYTCSQEYLSLVAQTAGDLGVGIHTHISESRNEIREIGEKYGMSPVAFMNRCGILGSKTVAAHCVHLTDDDIRLLGEKNVNVATNPISNLKLSNGFSPVPRLLSAGINVCLGTDGAASNNSLNLFRDLNYLSTIHKGKNEDPLAVSAAEAFRCATTHGAKALGLSGVTGEIREGLAADLVILDLSSPNMQPVNNPINTLCYSASGFETETVFIGGKRVYDKGEYPAIDCEKVYYEVEKICKRIGMRS